MSVDVTEEELQIASLKIEKGVPLRTRYPHAAFSSVAERMEVGDSIWTDDSRIINGISCHLNKTGKEYQTRREGEGRRIWRVK